MHTLDKGTPLVQIIPLQRVSAALPGVVKVETLVDAATRRRIRRNTRVGDGWHRNFARAPRQAVLVVIAAIIPAPVITAAVITAIVATTSAAATSAGRLAATVTIFALATLAAWLLLLRAVVNAAEQP